jgi:hypothetical protein
MRRICWMGLLVSAALAGCGGSDDDAPPPPPPTEWVKIDSIYAQSTAVQMSGQAWVSKNWVGYRCVGFACRNTDDFPGVKVTWFNETARTGGDAVSVYGGGTSYIHRWSASIPLEPGRNVIFIHAYDPSGRGASITTEVIPPG